MGSSAAKQSSGPAPQPRPSRPSGKEDMDEFDQMDDRGNIQKKTVRPEPKSDISGLLEAAKLGFAYQLAGNEMETDVEREISALSKAPPPKARPPPVEAPPPPAEADDPEFEFEDGGAGLVGPDAFGPDVDLNASRSLRRMPKVASPAPEGPGKARRASHAHEEGAEGGGESRSWRRRSLEPDADAPPAGGPSGGSTSVRRFSGPGHGLHDHEAPHGAPHQAPHHSPGLEGSLRVTATGSLKANLHAGAVVAHAVRPPPSPQPPPPPIPFLARSPAPGLAAPVDPLADGRSSPVPAARGAGGRARIVTGGGIAVASGPRQQLDLSSYQIGLVN